MAIYLVDLAPHAPNHDYGPLWQAMDKVDARRALDTTWFLETPQSVQELTAELAKALDPKDRFLIVEVAVGAKWSAVRLEHDTGPWLKAHRP